MTNMRYVLKYYSYHGLLTLRKRNFMAAVYLAAVMEFLAGNAAMDNKKSCIIPHHLQLAIGNDEEQNELMVRLVRLAEGGVLRNISQ